MKQAEEEPQVKAPRINKTRLKLATPSDNNPEEEKQIDITATEPDTKPNNNN